MDQQPQSIIKKPSKFSRFVRFIFGSCGGKSVEKKLVEDEKDGNRDYSASFSSSGADSDSAYSSKEKGSKNGKLQNEFQKVTDDIKEELQVVDLKRKLTETTEELLEIHPSELKFIFELKKQSTCSVRLFNKSNNHVAFKVKTASPKKYSMRPNIGIIKPKSTCEFTVMMQAQRVAPPDMICKVKFLVQSTVVPAGTSDDDITPSIFAKDDVRYVEENKLKVVLVSPPNSPVLSPINRTLKQVPAYEPSILKDQVLRKVESLTQRHTVTEDVESKVENSEEANSAKNLEYKTRKDADEPLMNVGYKTRKEVDEPTIDVEHKTRMDVDEPTTDVEHKTMNDMEELKLVKDVSEMKSKLNGLESKLSEAEVIMSKLTEERRLNAELLEIHPRELKFIFELKKLSTCSVRLFNKSNNHVAFKVKATSPKKYSVRPNIGIIKPKSTCEFTVKMQAQRVAPPDMICKDMFLVQSTVVPAGTSDDDITRSIFAKDDVRYVEENKLKVVLVSPPNSLVLSPINRTLKQVPAYEPSILKDQVLRKVESLTQRHTVTEDVESKVENSEEANSAKNLEYKTRKDADEPLMNVGYKTRKEVDEPTTDVEHKTRMDVDEPTTDVEHKTMNDMEELKLVKDVSEMKSKLNGLESKLSEAEVIISKERESLQQELTLLMSKRLVSVMKNVWEIVYITRGC